MIHVPDIMSHLKTARRRVVFSTLCVVMTLVTASSLAAADVSDEDLAVQFGETIEPFAATYCIGCHGGTAPASKFDMSVYSSMETVVEDFPHWNLVLGRLKAGDMPPSTMPQPPADERQQVIEWIENVRSNAAMKNAGDPGAVLARRLSNAEYNYTIRDLTGVNLEPTREFPIDPANLAGFDNSGESLTMSPALLNKYLQAAREVANHMVLGPDGFEFAEHPMLVETDREKYTIQRIVDFYNRQPTDFADYFQAAWSYKHRVALNQPNATLASVAAESHVSAKYLPMVWRILEGNVKENVGPIARLRGMWDALPAPGNSGVAREVRSRAVAMRDYVVEMREDTAMLFAAPEVDGLTPWSQPLINWKFAKFAASRRQFDHTALREASAPLPELPEIPPYPGLGREAAPRARALQLHGRIDNMDLVVPDGEMDRYVTAFTEFSDVFPHRFYISERGRFFPDESNDKGRYLSAGYHNVMGYYRDDTALIELLLDDDEVRELNRLWDEFDFIADYTARTWDQYWFNQSGEVMGKGRESGSERPPDRAIDEESVILEMRDTYLAKVLENPENDAIASEAVQSHFQGVNDTLRRIEKMRDDAEPRHVAALLTFAERAYRRPLTPGDKDDIQSYYYSLRDGDSALSHEDAVRDSIVSVLMSPDYLYRIDLIDGFGDQVGGTQQARVGDRRALSPYALANRLSFFLWSSMPDEELLSHAADGSLLQSDVLAAQTRRMLKDPRVRGLASEFAGNWLEFRRFEQHNAVDRARFPAFDDSLRQAMFEEPLRYIEDALINDRSILDLVYGNYTFVNPTLARHYGMSRASQGPEDQWVRVDHADKFDRGGLLPMSLFLTLNSPGLRTSPVKRGYWIVRRVLGEEIPPPPPVVPELPQDESKSDLPLPELLAQHRENPLCAACHARFDSFGLALEGYGPVGERRGSDLAGRMVSAIAEFPGGGEGNGLAGVKAYIREHRQDDFIENVSRKMLAYALSRSLQLSDEPLIEQAQANIKAKDFRFSALMETIVTSPQFVQRRDPVLSEQRSFVPNRGE